ncbi:hypothetical protein SEVIR_9G489550v4 [Setaria viridis]
MIQFRGSICENSGPLTAAGEVAPPRRPAISAIPAARKPRHAPRVVPPPALFGPPLFLLRRRTATATGVRVRQTEPAGKFLPPRSGKHSAIFSDLEIDLSAPNNMRPPWADPTQPLRASPINNAEINQENVVRWTEFRAAVITVSTDRAISRNNLGIVKFLLCVVVSTMLHLCRGLGWPSSLLQ